MSRRRFKAQRIRHNDLGIVSTNASTSQPTNLQYLPVGMAAFVDFQDSSKGIENHGFYAGHGYSYLSVRDNLIFAELPGLFYACPVFPGAASQDRATDEYAGHH